MSYFNAERPAILRQHGHTLTKSGGTMYGGSENRLTSAVVPGTGT